MDDRKYSISPDALYARLGSEAVRFIALPMGSNSGKRICRADAKSSPTAFMGNR